MEVLYNLSAEAGALLKARGETIAVAESSAGGLISAALLAVPGASAYFRSGAALYSVESRAQLLDVVVDRSVSPEQNTLIIARAMRLRLATTWAVGETGWAGPTGRPAGRCFVAITGPSERTKQIDTGLEDRLENMRLFAEAALRLLVQTLSA
jgi:PncC family amidohydrolase